ncbi:DUF2892 domain-containing protein [Candidatus Uhrbacteria bacterium]|nr:DUF2892 domain-containing protein [Candidatus Uhrbacteria bacterium]
MLHRNLGFLDRVLRFALAVWWLGLWAPVFPYEWANWGISIIGWIALVESFLGWCGFHALWGIHDCDDECVST